MRKLLFSIIAAGSLLLTGCYDTIQEITLNEDGSGTISNSNDLSGILGVAKNMGAGEELEKAGEEKLDSTIQLADGVDSIPNLTPEEKKLASKGTLKLQMDLKAEKFVTNLIFPFSKPSDIITYNKLSGKILSETMKDQAGGMPTGGDDMPEVSSLDDYYTYEYSNGELKKKVNKEKYAGVANDKYLEQMKEAASMGLSMKASYIINLPRPAKEVEGKNVKLSDDKKKVTITASLDDFMADASVLEFKVKY